MTSDNTPTSSTGAPLDIRTFFTAIPILGHVWASHLSAETRNGQQKLWEAVEELRKRVGDINDESTPASRRLQLGLAIALDAQSEPRSRRLKLLANAAWNALELLEDDASERMVDWLIAALRGISIAETELLLEVERLNAASIAAREIENPALRPKEPCKQLYGSTLSVASARALESRGAFVNSQNVEAGTSYACPVWHLTEYGSKLAKLISEQRLSLPETPSAH